MRRPRPAPTRARPAATTGGDATGSAAAAPPEVVLQAAGRMPPADVAAFLGRLADGTPTPVTELAYTSPFTLLVAVLLSAQATDVGVNKATPALFAAAPTPEAMLALGEDRIRGYIKTIGLFNTKAKNVAALSRMLVEQHGGQVPADRAVLETLPGVGRKT